MNEERERKHRLARGTYIGAKFMPESTPPPPPYAYPPPGMPAQVPGAAVPGAAPAAAPGAAAGGAGGASGQQTAGAALVGNLNGIHSVM